MKTFENCSIVLFGSLFLMNNVKGFTGPALTSAAIKIGRSTTCHYEKPGWLDDALKGIPSDDEFDPESYKNGISLQSGISGFSVDPELGFVSILVTNSNNENDDKQQNWIPVVISPVDTDRPKSTEALTCVQLAGGLDLGTAILPPNSLAKLVADNNNEEQGITSTSTSSVKSKARLSLTKVTALPNPDATISIEEETEEIVPTTPERDQAILDALPKVEKAVKTLPGLEQSTTDTVLKAMQRFADEKGAVDRTAFTSILGTVREANSPSSLLASPIFRLEVSIIDGDGISQATIDTTNAMIALGLAMRYKVVVGVDDIDGHQQGGIGLDALLERFSEFRPIQELSEDSKVIDGFIPSMFEKAKKIDNDMKEE